MLKLIQKRKKNMPIEVIYNNKRMKQWIKETNHNYNCKKRSTKFLKAQNLMNILNNKCSEHHVKSLNKLMIKINKFLILWSNNQRKKNELHYFIN